LKTEKPLNFAYVHKKTSIQDNCREKHAIDLFRNPQKFAQFTKNNVFGRIGELLVVV
jgi:hypothetical protein